MKITIVGGGNIGTQFAVHCAEKKHEVCIYTSTPDTFRKHLTIVDENGKITHEGNISSATNNPEEAFRDAELILVTVPATAMNKTAEVIYSHSDSNVHIGVVPGNGGSECAFNKCILRGNVFFAIERVPAIARLITKGESVRSTGYRNELHIASLPAAEAKKCCEIIAGLFDIRCLEIPNILNLTMTPSNPVLHTTRLKTLFRDYHEGVMYDRIPLFYEEWDNASSELLLACDEEVQNICRALPEFRLDYVKSLKDHYESYSVDEMTKKISGIQAFKGLKTPSVQIGNKYIPDLHSRYFTADFSYGLKIIKQIADFAGVQIPNINETLDWYHRVAVIRDEFEYKDYNISSFTEFKKYYMR